MTVKDLLKLKIGKNDGLDCIVFQFVSNNFTYEFYKNGNSWKRVEGEYSSHLKPKGRHPIFKTFLERLCQ